MSKQGINKNYINKTQQEGRRISYLMICSLLAVCIVAVQKVLPSLRGFVYTQQKGASYESSKNKNISHM